MPDQIPPPTPGCPDPVPGQPGPTRPDPLGTVEEIGRLLAADAEPMSLARSVVEAAVRQTGAEYGLIVCRTPGDGVLNAAVGMPDFEPGTPAVEGLAATIGSDADAGVIRVEDADADPRPADRDVFRAATAGRVIARSGLTAPVVARGGNAVGRLFLGHPRPGRFGPADERTLACIARYGALAIDQARLFDRVRAGHLDNARLAAIVQSSDDAIIGKDLNGVVWSWNAGAERMFGYTAEEMIGKPITVLIPADRPDEEIGILARLRRGERVDHFETERITRQGRRIFVSVTSSPIRDEQGRIVGASKVARDITERKRAEIEREHLLAAERAARSEAERHSRMKDEFLATLGHELRTPLNAVLGWAHLLQKGSDPAELREGLGVIERNARVQAQLIEDLLDMSRIVAGNLRLSVQPVDLHAVIEAALASVRPAADARNVTVRTILDPLAGPVSGDPGRLQQVFWNLLSNAVKFTPKQGKVEVLLERVNSHVEISVSDTGEGIAPDFLPFVFDRFRQADASTTRQHGGLGLGLSIVKHLTELHGGSVRAKSPGLGQGATFIVSLPVRVTTSDPASPSRADHADETIMLTGIRILVVDDDPDARDLVRRMLANSGAEVRTAASAAEAVVALREKPPHLLISDIGMPGEDGFGLIRKVRALPEQEGGRVPAVALTAFAGPEDRRRALLAGFQMHVPKPVEPGELIAVVASVTRRI